MAESMVLRIVLEGVDNASDDIERTKGGVDKLGSSFTDAEKKGAAFVLTVNGLASGLNQMSGGLRKSADSMEELNIINEDTADSMRNLSRTMEAIAGPMEVIAGIVTTVAALTYLASAAGLSMAGVWAGLSTALGVAAVVLGSSAIVIGALAGSILLLTGLLYSNREAVKEALMEYDSIANSVKRVRHEYERAADAVGNFTDAIMHPGRTLTNMGARLKDETRGVSLSRLT